MDKIISIINNTPIWAWVILVFLLYKGLREIKTYPVRLMNYIIFPVIFLPLSIFSVVKTTQPILAAISLTMGLATGLFIGKITWKRNPLLMWYDNQWIQKGSYLPLSLYLFIFFSRYIISASQSSGAHFINTTLFNVLVGFPVGIGLGMLLAILLFKEKRG